MREVEQKDFTFSNDDYLSIFIGICKSQELLNHYMEQDYSLLNLDYIGSEFGIDFNINCICTFIKDFFSGISCLHNITENICHTLYFITF